jgi:iron complex outermembrane receptor protein
MLCEGAAFLLIPTNRRSLLLLVFLVGQTFVSAAVAPDPARRPFDIGAGDAAETLKHFSAQARREIMFPAESVAGVKTNAVKGVYTPRDALDRMIAHTGLFVVEDPRTGALMVTHPDPGRSAEKTRPDSNSPHLPENTPTTMKRKNPIAVLTGWLAVALASGQFGQAADGTPINGSSQNAGSIAGRVQNVVSGRYLANARVSVKGTNTLILTDEFGQFVLPRVPSGPVTIEVFYTGMVPQEIPLVVPAGQTVTQDIRLAGVLLGGPSDGTVALDPFVVASTKESDGEALAINEQRFAANIKNVVSTESFGDVVGGNHLADFIKFIPGVQTSGGQFESELVLVRGFPAGMTVITSDGGGLATTQPTGNTRNAALQGFSINNYSRVEILKVPTPATRSDTMAGSVNMISKNAFERSRAEFRYQANLTGNSHNLTLARQPYTNEKRMFRINPGFSFDYTLPVNDRFGLVLTASHANTFFEQNRMNTTYTTTGAGTGASINRPFLSGRTLTDAAQYRYRSSLGMRVDWKTGRHSVLSFNAVTSLTLTPWSENELVITTGTTGTPTVTGGIPFSYGEDFTNGATGRGSASFRQTTYYRQQSTTGGTLRYNFDDGNWKVDALGSQSLGKAWFRNFERGTFSILTTAAKVPIRVVFSDIDPAAGPRGIKAYDNGNREFDLYDPNNYILNTATNGIRDIRDDVSTGNLDLKRRFNFLPFPFSVQVGGSFRENERDRTLPSEIYTHQGVNGDRSSAPYLAKVYANQPMRYNDVSRGVPNLSTYRAYEAWQANPALFTMTPAQVVAAAINQVQTSENIKETVGAYYFQSEARLFNNRLQVLTGVRYEKTTDDGSGALRDDSAVFVRNANGTFARNAAGARIRKPEAGAVGSLQEAQLVYRERGYHARRSYDGYYPSLHLTFNLTSNFLARAAYAKTYGRPAFADIIPNAVTSENDVDPGDNRGTELGTITVRNTGLLPWSAENFDLSLDYYTDTGGTFGASLFHKEITNFFGQFQKIATLADLQELGLDSRYEGWRVSTKTNAGDASVSGLELSLSHSLRPFGEWGRNFKGFINATKLRLKGAQDADFAGFLPESLNWGVTFARKRVTAMAKWNYRSAERRGLIAAFGPDANQYYKARTHLDINLSYSFRPNLSLFLNARNVMGVADVNLIKGSQVPYYAEQSQIQDYGVPFSIGLKGSF